MFSLLKSIEVTFLVEILKAVKEILRWENKRSIQTLKFRYATEFNLIQFLVKESKNWSYPDI